MLERLVELDHSIFLALNFDGGVFWDSFFGIVTAKAVWIPLYLLILWLIYRRYGLRNMFVALGCMLLMVAAADQTCNLFKTNLPRFRPSHMPELAGLVHTIGGYSGGLYGTVSAHAAASFSIAMFSARLIHSRVFTLCIVLWALLICYSRIYVGLHFPKDLIYGTIVGLIFGWLALLLFRFIVGKLDRRRQNKYRDA